MKIGIIFFSLIKRIQGRTKIKSIPKNYLLLSSSVSLAKIIALAVQKKVDFLDWKTEKKVNLSSISIRNGINNMARFELKLPKMGESVAEATITNWLKEVGDKIEADEAVLEIATDKVDSEVPSEVSGVLVEKLFESISGSGKEGRITKEDILSYVKNRGSQPVAAVVEPVKVTAAPVVAQTPVSKSQPATPVSVNGGDEVIEMDRMRKLISGYMVASVQTSAHVQSFIEVDVTNIVKWRDKVKNAFEKREGEKLTYTPIFMEAVAKALKDFPGMNISVDGDFIIKKKNINLGMAAALPNGNLIVPVIKSADQLNLVGMAKAVNDLGNRAKMGKLKPDDTQGGTYTVTNVGTFGSVFGTPIINQPQVGILALGAIRKVPAVIETPEGDFIGIRQKMFLSHSYDHRVVDGALGGSFTRQISIICRVLFFYE
uniref:Dihydrolipoamide acetyltransferase component of pyruvate dehydrogenase complex n=1 Tax=Hucho hucho TaxID=62062 RepID=A0A4W5LAL9_9TELE